MRDAFGCDDAVLRQVRPHGADLCGPLPDQQVSGTMQHENALCISRLDRHEAHGGSPDGLADRLRIGSIVLVPLHIRLHVSWRHQLDLMAKRRQLARPMMRRRACLHADKARLEAFEHLHKPLAANLSAEHRSALAVDAMNLKDVLRDVQTDGANLHGAAPLRGWSDDSTTMAQCDAVGSGAVHPIKLSNSGAWTMAGEFWLDDRQWAAI